MAERLAPLNDLLKKGRKLKVTEEMRKNIGECIKMLQSEPVLIYPDFSKPFILTTDASKEALGAVLAQAVGDAEKPVAFASRRLTETEERYSALERELLAVVWAVEYFRPYLYGRRFIVHSDHKPLQWVAKIKERSSRVQKWKEILCQYTFEVRYKPGKENVVADWLSRAHQVNVTTHQEGTSGPSLRQFFRTWDPDGEELSGNDSDQHTEGTLSAEERREAMEEVQEAIVGKKRAIIWVATTHGLPQIQYGRRTKSSLRCTVRAPLSASEETVGRLLEDASLPNTTTYLYVGNAVAWTRLARLWAEEIIGKDRKFIRCVNLGEVVTDEQTQKDIVQAHHQGKTNHRGVEETLASLRRKYYWRKMKNMVKEVVLNCEICLQAKYLRTPRQAPQEETPTAMGPLVLLQADVFVWEGIRYVTLIDTFTKVAMAVPVENKSADEVVRALRRWAQVYGTPEKLVSDGGREFKNQQVQALLRTWKTEHHVTTAGHPQSHGAIERLHSTLMEHLRVLCTERGVSGHDAMELAIVGYNHSVHTATGFTPFEALFGTLRVGRDVQEHAGEPGTVTAVQQISEHQRRTREKVRSRLTREKRARVRRTNLQLRHPARALQLGDIVFRQVTSNRSKELNKFDGPYRVIALHERNRVTIRTPEEPSRQRTVHRDQLRVAGGEGEGEPRRGDTSGGAARDGLPAGSLAVQPSDSGETTVINRRPSAESQVHSVLIQPNECSSYSLRPTFSEVSTSRGNSRGVVMGGGKWSL